jgi:hypothetical protein
MSVSKFPSPKETRSHRVSGLEKEEILDIRSNRQMREIFAYTFFGLFLLIIVISFLAPVFSSLNIAIFTVAGHISPLAKAAALITSGFVIVLRSLFKK